MDVLDKFYYSPSFDESDSKGAEFAKRKAISLVLNQIMDRELTKKQCLCLKYKYLYNKTQSEIAEIMGISQPTVSRHINAAKDIVNNELSYCYLALTKGINEYDNYIN